MHVLLVLFLEICPFFPTILFSLVALSPNKCLPQGTFSKFDPDTPGPVDLGMWLQAKFLIFVPPLFCHLSDARAPSFESP